MIDFGKPVRMPFPRSLAEARSRPVYGALNMLSLDLGSANFGSVNNPPSLVHNPPSLVNDRT